MTGDEAVERMNTASELAAIEIGSNLGRVLTDEERLLVKLAFAKGASHGADAVLKEVR